MVADSQAKGQAGRVVRLDRGPLGFKPVLFERGSGDFQVPEALGFERLIASSDGKRVAAAADASKVPLVCVWEANTGKLTHWITAAGLEVPVLALSFSSDSRYLVTGGEAPEAKLWDLSVRRGSLDTPSVRLSDRSIRKNITCVAIRPEHASQVVTGHSDGQVHLWSWAGGKAKLEIPGLIQGEFAGAVKSVCFTSDGGYLAAAGDGLSIWVGTMTPRPRPIESLDKLRPHHSEQINTLTTWKGLPILISGGDDTTVRFWDLKNGRLWGTFSSPTAPAVADAATAQEVDWVLYTPEGLYDAPPTATRLVQYRLQDRPHQIEQFESTHNEYRLSERLLAGENPRAVPKTEEPFPISISVPPRSDPTLPATRLTIALGAQGLKDIRLYHNDVLVPCAGPEKPEDSSLEVEVRLVPDRNRFYAMASQASAYDACSPVVEVDYAAPRERGRVHILAIGVEGYVRRPLRFADQDARQLSEVLYQRGTDAKGQRGTSIVLLDSQVTVENVEKAFDRLARQVEDRPQDTVVVFLAGHTGVFADPEGFCLLLPTYPVADTAAPSDVAAREADQGVAAKVNPKLVLPYTLIASSLARLRALQRLVIVDACQGEAILLDKRVRAMQKWMEISSRRVRTSYIMAAGPTEPALAAEALQHGLLTYALLRGMGAVPSVGEPQKLADLGLRADADFNQDGFLSTSELDAYAKQVLPKLASIFPEAMANVRGSVRELGTPSPGEKVDPAANASFNLVPIR